MQTRGFQILSDDLGARRKRGFDPRFARKSQCPRLARDQSRPNQNIGVRGVCAGRDRGNDDLARGHGVLLALDRNGFVDGPFERVFHLFGKGGLGPRQGDVILRPFGSGDCRNDRSHVQRQRVCVNGCVIGAAPQAIFLGIGFDKRDAILVAATLTQIAQRLVVDREKATCCAIFRRHVGNRCAIGQRQAIKTFAVKLDKFTDDAFFTQHGHDFKNQIGRGCPFDHRAGHFKSHDLGNQHRDRLAQHGGFGLDPANTPAKHCKTVDHRRVTVRPNQRVGINHLGPVLVFAAPDGLRQVFKVDLMADPCSRRNDAEIVKGALTPFQEGVAFQIAFIFPVHVQLKGPRIAEIVDHHAMVDHQIHRAKRVDLFRIPAKRDNPVPHRCQIDNRRNAGEVLHQNPRRAVGDFSWVLPACVAPFSKGADIFGCDGLAVFVAQHVFQNDFQDRWKAREITKACRLGRPDRIIVNAFTRNIQGLPCAV